MPVRSPATYSNELKLKVTLEALSEKLTQRELSQKYDIPQPLISIWKKNAILAIQSGIENGNKRGPKKKLRDGSLATVLSAQEVNRMRRMVKLLKGTVSTLEKELS